MSPRAAWRLESLGFSDVYDFVPGKAAWLAMGWTSEGELAGSLTAGKVARKDIPSARIGETVGDAHRRAAESGLDLCLVVNKAEIYMGRLRGRSLEADPTMPVEMAMEHGSSTVRPSEPLEGLVKRMTKHAVDSIVVSDLKGRLIGALLLPDAQQALDSLSG
ncbi:MAG: CBS domain-containing protein [Actinomycetota bacterium]